MNILLWQHESHLSTSYTYTLLAPELTAIHCPSALKVHSLHNMPRSALSFPVEALLPAPPTVLSVACFQ